MDSVRLMRRCTRCRTKNWIKNGQKFVRCSFCNKRKCKLTRRRAGRGGKGKCQICHTRGNMYLDHNHKTGVIRGRLCLHCNLALGHVRDRVVVLQKMIRYL